MVKVKKKSEITAVDVQGFRVEWREKWREWVVIDDRIVYDSYDAKEEAERIAGLLKTAHETTDKIDGFAENILNELSDEETEFLRKLTGGSLTVEI